MHFTRASAACLSLFLLALATPAEAQFYEETAGTASIGDYNIQDNFGGAYSFGNDGGSYLLFQKMVGDGTGYTASYQRLGLRLKMIDLGNSHLWGEGHVIITDESRTGINVGGGYRWVMDNGILGIHGWYDNFQTDFNNRYSQVTFGAEWLHNDFDVRVNTYFPFGDETNFIGIADPGTVPVFIGNNISFYGTALEEQAMKGFDAEAGVPLFMLPWARAYAGGYFYSSDNGNDAPGARGRIEAAISDDLSLNFMVSNDRVFNTNYNIGVEYRFSGSVTAPTLCPFNGPNRKYAQVRRQWPIATRVAVVPALVGSINVHTGRLQEVVHVDNTNPDPGDGTFENPFRMLPDSAPDADLILVYTGMGSTVGNITLEDRQRMLGEGKPFAFWDVLRGEVLLPESFARTGLPPTLVPVDPSENLITLGNYNEVNNFNVIADGTTAIGGMDVNSFRIEMIGGRAENGIRIVNASGQGIINGFGMSATPFESTDTGIFVSNTSGGTLFLDVDEVHTTGGDVGLRIAAMGGNIVSSIDTFRGDNQADAGMILSALASSAQVTEVDNAFVANSLGTTGRGIVLDVASGGAMNATMNMVGAVGNDDLLAVDVSNGLLNATITDSLFSDSVSGSGVQFTLDNARGTTTLTNLNANRNAIDGLNAVATGLLNNYSINVIDSRLIANVDDAIDTSVSGGGTLNLFVDPTLAMFSVGGSGFEFDVRDPGSVLIAEFEDTNLSDNALHAVDGNVESGGFANLSLLRSLGDRSGDNGLNLNVDTGGWLVGSFDTGSFSSSGGNGVEVAVDDGSSATLGFDNTPATMNAENGLLFTVTDGMLGPSDLTINVANGDFSDNPLANVIGSADGAGSQATLNFVNTTASNMAAVGGLVLDATAGGIINTNWTLGSISNTGSDGVRASVDGPGSQIRLNLAGLTIQGNMGDGIDGLLTSGGPGSMLDVDLTSTVVTMNMGNGLDLSLSGMGAMSRVNIVDSLLFNNMGDGFEFDVLAGAELIAVASGTGNFNSNAGRAWSGIIDGPGSAAALNLNGTNGDFSGLEGGRFDVTDGGLFNLTMFNVNVTGSRLDGLLTNVDGMGSEANFNLDTVRLRNNGNSGMGDGFEVVATDGAMVNAQLDNMLVTGNRDNAFRFDVSTGSIVDTRLMLPSADGNGRSGLSFDVTTGGRFAAVVEGGSFSNAGNPFDSSGVVGSVRGLGSTANTLFDGTTVDNNTMYGFDLFVDTGARLTTRLNTSGTYGTLSASGNTLSGVRFNAQNGGPTFGNILMSGPNEFNNNGGFGVDIDGVDILQMAAGFSGSAMDNGDDGVNIFMDNVARGAIAIDGAGGTVSGNMGDGIEITLIDTELKLTPVGPDLIPPMVINGLILDDNAGHGLVVMANNSDLTDAIISGNIATNNMGNGLYVMLTDSMADNLQIVRNNANDNMLNGINVELLRTPIDNLQIDDNGTFGGGASNLGLQFFIDGNTFTQPYSIANNSDPGIDITGFQFDILPSSHLFDTVEPQGSTPFQPQINTDVTTGLLTVNGTGILPGTDPLQNNMGMVLVGGGVADNSSLIDLTFGDFNPGETFIWLIDADPLVGTATVLGSDLIGSTVVVDFSNGAQLTGALMAVPGDPDASIFIATGGSGLPGSIDNNGLNGIRLFADDSDLTNLSMQNNAATNNGQSGALIDAVNGSDVTTATLANNQFDMNGNGGLILDFDDSSLTDATISDSSMTGNTGDGILFDFNNSPINNLVIRDNPDIDQNTGNGINFQMVGSNITGLLIDNNGMGAIVPMPPVGDFDIQLNLAPGLTPSQIAAFQSAELRWESIITGDLPPIGMIDDVLIDASAIPIDGPGGILGQAGPTGLRAVSFLPFQGIMQFDTADLASLEMAGQLEEVILHEMAHVLGFGTIWDNLGLLLNPASMGGMDPRFTGALATTEYNARFGTMDADVPVEGMAGPGTNDAHWRESVFTNELMTGFLNGGIMNPISRTTIAQFDDLGYVVDISQADPFLVLPPGTPGPGINGVFNNNLDQVVVDIANAMSSDISALRLGNAGVAALAAIQQNGLNGINIDLTNSDLTGGMISNNIIAGHTGGDGVRMIDPTTTGTPIELDFDSNTINGNSGGAGVNFQISQADLDSEFTGNEIAGNGTQGINLDLSGTTTADLVLTGNTLSNNGAEGLNISASGMAVLSTLDIDGNEASGNANDGIGLFMSGSSSSPAVNIINNTANNNNLNGIHVALSDTAMIGTLAVDNNIATGNGMNGILIDTGSPNTIGAISVSGSSNISGNTGNGIEIILRSVLGTPDIDVNNNNVLDNLGGGIVLSATSTPLGDVTMDGNMVLNNTGGDGILLLFDNAVTNSVTLTNNLIGQSGNNGINLDLTASPIADLQINDNMIGMANVGGGGGSGVPVDDSLPLIRAGFDANSLAANDDGSTGLVPLGFDVNFFGQTFSDAFVNNNGNITFDQALSTFTPFDLLSTSRSIIAPFFADVDTRAGNIVTYGTGMIASQDAFGVNWIDVRHFSVNGPNSGLPENSFQLVLVDRSDIAVGDFDIEFNYDQVLWEAGTASGSDEFGLGGSAARAGFSNGVNMAFELPGSAVNGAFLDGGPAGTSLIQNNLNSVNDGRYIFFARNGGIGIGAGGNTGDGIRINATAGSNIGSMNIDGNSIEDNGSDGIEIVAANSTLPAMGSISNNSIASHIGGDGIRIIDPDTNNTAFGIDFDNNTITDNAGGAGINLRLGAGSGEFTGTITDSTFTGNGTDGISLQNAASANGANITVTGITASNNALRGVSVSATNDDGARSTFNIGQIGAAENVFEGNGQQAVVFRTQATAVDQTQSAANTDVRVDEFLDNPAPAAYFDTGSRDIVRATMNLLNARIFNNGAEGVLLDVGSNTLMNSQLAGINAGSNVGDDIVITPFVSANPPDSIDDAAAFMDTLVFDPVAHLDLAIGAADLNNDTFPEATVMTQNKGDVLTVNFTGTNFSNTDPFKNDRAVRLSGQVQIMGSLNSPQNSFSLGGVLQDLDVLFGGMAPVFNIVPATSFPDNTVP